MKFSYFLFLLAISQLAIGQVSSDTQLFKDLKKADSLLFDVGFNTCNVQMFRELVDEDFEFYHDQSGITPDKATFISGTENGLCQLDYQPIRKLNQKSLKVYPLYNNGELYGGIQEGVHSFYALRNGELSGPTSKAQFTHLWLIKDGNWKLSRVLSYNHGSE